MWTKPAASRKTGKAHRVPLSRQALDVLLGARSEGLYDMIVFPGSRPGAMLGNKVMTQALRNAGVAASGHGFRSSFKDWGREHGVDDALEVRARPLEGSATVAATPGTSSSGCVEP